MDNFHVCGGKKRGNIPCYSHLCIRKYVHIKGGALNQLGWWEEIVYFNILGICMILHILYQILPSLVCLVVFFLSISPVSHTLYSNISSSGRRFALFCSTQMQAGRKLAWMHHEQIWRESECDTEQSKSKQEKDSDHPGQHQEVVPKSHIDVVWVWKVWHRPENQTLQIMPQTWLLEKMENNFFKGQPCKSVLSTGLNSWIVL